MTTLNYDGLKRLCELQARELVDLRIIIEAQQQEIEGKEFSNKNLYKLNQQVILLNQQLISENQQLKERGE